jgi:hypothetical protein
MIGRHARTRLGAVRKRTMAVPVALVATMAVVGFASPAMATPTKDYAVFAQCPTEYPGLSICTFSQTTSGEFAIGETKVPINKTVTLQGGGVEIAENEYALLPAKNGESLSKTELNVPGGLTDIVNCEEIKGGGFFEVIERESCKLIFENKTTGVTATTELVASATNPAILNLAAVAEGAGTGLVLPVRVHLKNTLLGEGCYVGSEAHPIELHLTTGTTSPPAPNKPIKGSPGTLSEEEEVLVLSKNSLVDNSFSVPVAEGCGGFFSFLIDPIVDSKLGLESKGGHNTAILSGTTKVASAENVKKSE